MASHPYQQSQPDYGQPSQLHHQPHRQQQDYEPYERPLPHQSQPQLPVSTHQYQQHQQSYQQPQQQSRRPQTQPAEPSSPTPTHPGRKSRGFSFRSDKSAESHSNKANLQESAAEKHARRLEGKADPRLAMNEAEPAVVAQMAGDGSLVPLRDIQHKDLQGNPISDPDRSNPTRSRWERPLDTIRSFESAIDGSYHRKSMLRSDSDSIATWNRRTSYYGHNGPRFPQDSYYGGRPASTMRPDSMVYDQRQSTMMSAPRDGYFDGHDRGRNRISRTQTDMHMMSRPNGAHRNVYPTPQNHQSYETVASGSGSGSYNEPAGYQTDPTSSENSSINRRSPPKRQEQPMNDYGINFGGQNPAYQAPNIRVNNQNRRPVPQQQAAPPPVPRKESSKAGGLLRKASKVGASTPEERPGMGEKRKSWFARRFSKAS